MNVAIIGGGPASPKTTSRGLRIAVIGGGFTGLSAAYELTKKGHAVTVFEAAPVLGGLAYGFLPAQAGQEPAWDWHLEYAYHHLFTNDSAILHLIQELGIGDKIIIRRPVTANLYKGNLYQLDSPAHLFAFPGLTIIDKFRTAFLLAFLKINPFWKPLENFTAEHILCSVGGKHAYTVLWEPLLVGKFGELAPTVSAAWFWARIKKRTPSLCYIRGGFHTLITTLEKTIQKQGGTIHTSTPVASIAELQKTFDRILLTVPSPIAQKLIPELRVAPIPHLFAQTLILETKKPMLKDVYWLNVTDRSYPFLAAVAHTNFIDKAHYGGHHLTYFGNYLPQGHKYLSMSKDQLLKTFSPYIQKLNPTAMTKGNIINTYMFVGPFAQPVHQLHYSTKAPKWETPLPGVYLANMDSIVPWDRGTNYAVELGQIAARKILSTIA